MKKVLMAVLCSAVSLPSAVVAREVHDIGQIVVTAAKSSQNISQIGSSATVITREEIEKSLRQNAAEVLRNIPGVSVVRTAGPGSMSLVYLRGGQPGQTMVLIDGVEAKDPTEIDGGFFDFASISTNNIERIEIIRGPQSALYGSSAMAGVINIITKKGAGPLSGGIKLEGGSYNTYNGSFDIGSGAEKASFFAGGSYFKTKGFSAAETGEESDGAALAEINGGFAYNLSENSNLEASIRHSSLKADLDDGAFMDDPNHTLKKKMYTSRLGYTGRLNNRWEQKLTFSLLDTKREYRDDPDPLVYEEMDAWYRGSVFKADWQNNLGLFSKDDLTLGAEYQKDSGESFYRSSSSWGDFEETFIKRSAENNSVYMQYRPVLGDDLFATFGVRADSHQYFDEEVTYSASAAYYIPFAGTRLSGSAGKGFKAPSVYQLFSDYGDKNLKPELVKSYDIGFDQNFMSGRLNIGAKYFHNSYDDLINYDPVQNKYANVSKAVAKGVEADVKYSVLKSLSANAGYTYMDTRDKTAERALILRPKSTAKAGLDWDITNEINASAAARYTGKALQYMPWPDLKRSPSYTIAYISLNYKVADGFSIFARGENIFDKKYHEVYGYNSPGVSYYAGCKLDFGRK